MTSQNSKEFFLTNQELLSELLDQLSKCKGDLFIDYKELPGFYSQLYQAIKTIDDLVTNYGELYSDDQAYIQLMDKLNELTVKY